MRQKYFFAVPPFLGWHHRRNYFGCLPHENFVTPKYPVRSGGKWLISDIPF